MIESCELIIRQPGHPDRVVRLPEGASTMGRSEDCDIVLSDVGVSRHHARIILAGDIVEAEDLQSGNGTYYRGRRVQRQPVFDGDELIIDPFVLQIRIHGDVRKPPEDSTLDGPLARLDVIVGPGLARSAYPIPPRGLTMGRSETRDIIIPDPASSRHHCSVFFQDGQYVLRDMGSANGVFVNAYRVKESILTDGDRVQIGNTEFRFVMDDATKTGTPRSGGRESWAELERWSDNDVSLPRPERTRPRQAGGIGRWVPVALGGATVLTALAVVMMFTGAGLFVLYTRSRVPQVTTVPSGPPRWSIDVPAPGPGTDVTATFATGVEAMQASDHAAALASFYQTLLLEPNDASAERFAYVAGEYLVLGALESELEASSVAAERDRTDRDALLEKVRGGGAPARKATKALKERFRDDPVVIEAMDWDPSPNEKEMAAHVADAADALTRDAWSEAVFHYEIVRQGSQDPTLLKTAQGSLKFGYRELARDAAAQWRLGVLAEANGDRPGAGSHYQSVQIVDPSNPSARIRLERLEKKGP